MASVAVSLDNQAEREKKRKQFLLDNQASTDLTNELGNDASFRTYYRLSKPEKSLLMDSPAAHEPVAPFADLSKHLCNLGLSAPHIIAENRDNNFLLIEDFGNETFSVLLDQGRDPYELYGLAMDALAYLHEHKNAVPTNWKHYTADRLAQEAQMLVNWYYPVAKGEQAPNDLKEEWLMIWRSLLEGLPEVEQTLVLRDYHCDNLMFLEGRSGHQACGLLDFQDGLIGPSPYDLVSLLRNDRRAVPSDLQQRLLERYFASRPSLKDKDSFMLWYDALGLQRQIRILGLFYRLPIRDNKPSYLQFLPQVCHLINQVIDKPAFEPIKSWVEKHIGEIKFIDDLDFEKLRLMNLRDD